MSFPSASAIAAASTVATAAAVEQTAAAVEQTAHILRRNEKKTLLFPDWPEEVVNMSCIEVHRYIKLNRLTEEQQSDLRRVRRRKQGLLAARKLRRQNRAKTSTEPADSMADKPDVVQADVVDNVIKRARAAADAVADESADSDVNRIWLVINFLQKEADRMQTEQDAADAILQLSGNDHIASASDDL